MRKGRTTRLVCILFLLAGVLTVPATPAAGETTNVLRDDAACQEYAQGQVAATDTTTEGASEWDDVDVVILCEPEPAPSRIIISKVTDPSGAADVFSFTSDIDGFAPSLRDGRRARTSVMPGTYSVTELPAAGWELTDISCSGGVTSIDLATSTAAITVGEDETVRCAFTNKTPAEPEPATLTLAKVTDPPDDETTFRFFAEPGDWKPVLGHGDSSTIEVDPGTYTLTERFEHSWDLTSIVCDGGNPVIDLAAGTATVTVGEGDNVTCTYTNTVFCPQHAFISVEKYTDPVDESVPFGFTSDAVSREGDPFLPVLHHGESALVMVDPGTYSITELPVPGWALDGLTCDDPDSVIDIPGATATVTVSSSELATCVFTNTQIPEPEPGMLVIEKVTDPTGADATFQFTSTVDGFAPLLGHGESAAVEVPAGEYAMSEAVTDGWDLTDITCTDPEALTDLATGEATVTVPEGTTVTCTYTNTEIPEPGPGTLVIEKVTDPAGAGQEFAFLTITGGDMILFEDELGDGGSVAHEVRPGHSYDIAEMDAAGWELTDIACDATEQEIDLAGGSATVIVGADETVTCVFTNTQIPEPEPGMLVIEKVTDPTGADATFQFTSTVDGFAPLLGHGESAAVEVPAGEYAMSEAVTDGWDLTDITCTDPEALTDLATGEATVTVPEGTTVTCTYTNTEIPEPGPGTLVIEKVTDPAGADQAFDFSVSIGDGSVFDGQLRDGERAVVEVVTPDPLFNTNRFEIGEQWVEGWEVSDITCDSAEAEINLDNGYVVVPVDPGETVTCTFTNTLIPEPVVGSIGDFVWDDRNRNGVQDPGEPGVPGVRINLFAVPGWDFSSGAAPGGDGASAIPSARPLIRTQPSTDGMQLIGTTRTDSHGNYHFADLPAGYYVVEFTGIPAGYSYTTPFAAAKTIDSDAAVDSGRTPIMTLPEGFNDITCDAGLYVVLQPPEELPKTGADLQLPLAAGSVFLAAGLLLLLASRPRRTMG